MKRLLALAMSAVMALSLTACTSGTDNSSSVPEQSSSVAEERTTIRVGGLKGPTAMGMVKLMEDDAAGTTANDYGDSGRCRHCLGTRQRGERSLQQDRGAGGNSGTQHPGRTVCCRKR